MVEDLTASICASFPTIQGRIYRSTLRLRRLVVHDCELYEFIRFLASTFLDLRFQTTPLHNRLISVFCIRHAGLGGAQPGQRLLEDDDVAILEQHTLRQRWLIPI